MRRVGAGAGRRMGGNRVSFGDRVPLMNWRTGGTFTRASAASARTSSSTLQRYAVNERRFENGRLLCEIQGVYSSRYSEELDNAAWTKTNCTIVANAAAAPDGTTTADRTSVTTGGLVASISQTSTLAPAGNCTVTFWIRGTSSFTASYSFVGGTSTVNADVPVDTTWKQITARVTGVVAAALTVRPHSGAGTATVGNDIYVWGVNMSNVTVSASTVTVTSANVTRVADSLTYASGSWNTALATNPFTIEWCPNTDSGGLNAVVDLLSYGSVSDRLSVSNVDTVQVIQAGVIMVASSAITYSRDQVLTFTFRPAAGQVVVAGATTGNGTYSGTAWTMPTAVTLRVGGRVGSTAECCGGIGNPYPA